MAILTKVIILQKYGLIDQDLREPGIGLVLQTAGWSLWFAVPDCSRRSVPRTTRHRRISDQSAVAIV